MKQQTRLPTLKEGGKRKKKITSSGTVGLQA
jgi:hypothetical protein